MSTRVTVVLNMNNMSVTEKIQKAQQVLDNIIANPTVFSLDQGTLLTDLAIFINNLQAAQQAASDGGKTLTAVMHDKEQILMDGMHNVATYVERVAKDKVNIVHLAGLDVKRRGTRQLPEFEAILGSAPGSVRLRTRPQEGVLFKFQYSAEPLTAGSWIDAVGSKLSRTTITGLAPGFYWFRVVLMDGMNEHIVEPLRLAVR